jgi:hypothetical protein
MGTQPLKERVLIVGAGILAEEIGAWCLEKGYPASVLTLEGWPAPELRPTLEAEARRSALAVEALPYPPEAKQALVEILDAALPPEAAAAEPLPHRLRDPGGQVGPIIRAVWWGSPSCRP